MSAVIITTDCVYHHANTTILNHCLKAPIAYHGAPNSHTIILDLASSNTL